MIDLPAGVLSATLTARSLRSTRSARVG